MRAQLHLALMKHHTAVIVWLEVPALSWRKEANVRVWRRAEERRGEERRGEERS